MRFGFDVSNPGTAAIGGFDVAGGYLGGATPHAWTTEQWDAQPSRWRSMFWIPDGARDIAGQAGEILARLHQLGAPAGTLVWLDMETRVDAALVNGIANLVHAGGHPVGVYGSESTVFGNPPRSGYLVAHYDDVPKLYEHPHALGKQYSDTGRTSGGLAVDLDVYADSCPLWDTRPAPVTIFPKWADDAVADLTGIATEALAVRTAIYANVK